MGTNSGRAISESATFWHLGPERRVSLRALILPRERSHCYLTTADPQYFAYNALSWVLTLLWPLYYTLIIARTSLKLQQTETHNVAQSFLCRRTLNSCERWPWKFIPWIIRLDGCPTEHSKSPLAALKRGRKRNREFTYTTDHPESIVFQYNRGWKPGKFISNTKVLWLIYPFPYSSERCRRQRCFRKLSAYFFYDKRPVLTLSKEIPSDNFGKMCIFTHSLNRYRMFDEKHADFTKMESTALTWIVTRVLSRSRFQDLSRSEYNNERSVPSHRSPCPALDWCKIQ